MSELNIVGINTDTRIKEYLAFRKIDAYNLKLPMRECLSRKKLQTSLGISSLPFNPNSFNLFV